MTYNLQNAWNQDVWVRIFLLYLMNSNFKRNYKYFKGATNLHEQIKNLNQIIYY